ncbi:hypothetical protein IFU30_01055 [Plantibacter sp. CFBP 8798]|uniref:hypothetical protein n=1 Tax=Plantibacter sp. CFBP 8798 TaxID=2775268 RepID=UPI0017835CEC|nr:hypothetical protein [Plantibacter sp. CFBP 8798]MBD8464841.1 hypothetical protein [Plantibacter sp. CFBP 8798]
MENPRMPMGIAITMLHDGRVLLELLADRSSVFSSAETRVDDHDRTSAIVREWVTAPLAVPDRRGPHRPSPYRDGYTLVVSPGSTRDLAAFSTYGNSLLVDFGRAFGAAPGAAGDPEPLARALPRDLAISFRRAQEKAAWRLAQGAYLPVLVGYLDELRAMTSIEEQYAYETTTAGVGGILDDERYLLVADDARARQVYLDLLAERSSLYNWYMDLAKGGLVRPRR